MSSDGKGRVGQQLMSRCRLFHTWKLCFELRVLKCFFFFFFFFGGLISEEMDILARVIIQDWV